MNKLRNFIRAFPQLTWHFLTGYFQSLSHIWTENSIYWTLDQTYFSGDNPTELKIARNKFIEDYKALVTKAKSND